VSARLYLGEHPGILIQDVPPEAPPSETIRSFYATSHSESSETGRLGFTEIADDPVHSEHEGLGLALDFDRSDIPIKDGFYGPTEAVIDDLGPWFGTYRSGTLHADHRVRDLRITRGANPDRAGVRVALWYVPDAELPTPADVLDLID
jgi:hypothetical protein